MYGSIESKAGNLLTGEKIYLRTVGISDFKDIFEWENNPGNWEVSDTKQSFTEEEIIDFVSLEPDIYEYQQIRYMICLKETDKSIGCIDLFEFDEDKKLVGVGILIAYDEFQRRGFAKESLSLLMSYCQENLKIERFFCNIFQHNVSSIRLFESSGFKLIEKKDLNESNINYYEFKC